MSHVEGVLTSDTGAHDEREHRNEVRPADAGTEGLDAPGERLEDERPENVAAREFGEQWAGDIPQDREPDAADQGKPDPPGYPRPHVPEHWAGDVPQHRPGGERVDPRRPE